MVYNISEQIDDAFFASSHPVRRAVLEQLTHGKQSVTEVSRPYGLSKAQMTKHLAILERGGLVSRERQGRIHQLTLQADVLHEIMQWLQRYQQFWDTRLGALERFLDNAVDVNPESRD